MNDGRINHIDTLALRAECEVAERKGLKAIKVPPATILALLTSRELAKAELEQERVPRKTIRVCSNIGGTHIGCEHDHGNPEWGIPDPHDQ